MAKKSKTYCGLSKRRCKELHKIFGERWPAKPPCLLGYGCSIKGKLQAQNPDPVIVKKLLNNNILVPILKSTPNLMKVGVGYCPVYNVRIYTPCSRYECPLHIKSLRYLNCLVKYISVKGYNKTSLNWIAEVLGSKENILKKKLSESLTILRRKVYEHHLGKYLLTYKSKPICYFCYATPKTSMVIQYDTYFYACLYCERPLYPTPHIRKLQKEYGLNLGALVLAGWDLFKSSNIIASVLGLKLGTVEEVLTRLSITKT